MRFVSLIVSFLFFSSSTFSFGNYLKTEWEAWKTKHNKAYATITEDALRFTVWTENYVKIKAINAEQDSYRLGMNKFGDLTEAEFSKFVNPSGDCLKIHDVNDSTLFKQPEEVHMKEIPSSVNWANTSAYVTPVKNQGACGSCWAFSAAGATESAYAIAKGVLNTLSEQELVDCSTLDFGCAGGWIDTAFEYIYNHKGLALGSAYPYTATDGTCQQSSYTHYNPIDGFQLVKRYDETALATAVVDRPIGVAIQANQIAFQFYQSGILDGRCGTAVDHAVIIVGYGTEGSSQYWLVKNSWGTDWGEAGYVRICRDCDRNSIYGECCINCYPSFPLVYADSNVANVELPSN